MMTQIPLEKRSSDMSNKKLRDSGLVPTILYGPHFQPSKQMTVTRNALKSVLEHSREIFEVTVDRKKYFVKLSEMQTDPVGHNPIHLSLCELPKGSKIELKVPIQVEGDPSTTNPGATILMIHDYVTMKGDMKELPESIHVDVSKLQPGANIKIKDLNYQGAAKILDSSDEVLLICQTPHVQKIESQKGGEDLLSDSSLEETLR